MKNLRLLKAVYFVFFMVVSSLSKADKIEPLPALLISEFAEIYKDCFTTEIANACLIIANDLENTARNRDLSNAALQKSCDLKSMLGCSRLARNLLPCDHKKSLKLMNLTCLAGNEADCVIASTVRELLKIGNDKSLREYLDIFIWSEYER